MHWLGILLIAALLAMAPDYVSAQPAGAKGASPAAEPKVQEAGAPAPSVKSYTLKERQAYQKKVAADLDQLQQKINGLMPEAAKAKPQMKHSIARASVDLQKKVYTARNRLAALEKSSEKDWSRLKGELDKAMEELKKGYKNFEAILQ